MFSVEGPLDGGKRYIALRNTGGSAECGWILAPMNVPAPEGSVNGVGNVIWARDPKVRIAQPPTVAWYL